MDKLTQLNIEEFSRLQSYMALCQKDTPVYKAMKTRYTELKIILDHSRVNTAELDIIRE